MNITINGVRDRATGAIGASGMSNSTNTIVIPPPYCAHLIEVEDAHFHHDSAVLLPGYTPHDGTTDSHGSAMDLNILVASYIHATQSDQSILVVGHTDRSGSNEYNQTLSELRASNVYHALKGDRNRWVSSVLSRSKTEDYQHILSWLTHTQRWMCDPGRIDNVDGEKTRNALSSFQDEYNTKFKASIAVDGKIGSQTWGALFDVYMQCVADSFGMSGAELIDVQKSISFLTRPTVGCGEKCPITSATEANYRSPVDRRVEILFFESGEEPPEGALDICGMLYLHGAYVFSPISIDPDTSGVDVVTLLNELDEPAAEVSVEIGLSDGTTRKTMSTVDGKIRVFGKAITSVTIGDVHALSSAS